MSPRHPQPERPAIEDTDSGIKVMVSFRFPKPLTSTLKAEADERGWSFNQFVSNILDDIVNWFRLPPTVTGLLWADAEALGLDRRQYLMHVLLRRGEEIRQRGAGFDRVNTSARPKK